MSNSLLTNVTWTASYANTSNTFGTIGTPTKTQISTGTFTVNSTITQYSTQISIPSNATTGVEILFTVGAQTSGTWVIGNAQLEVGSSASAFEYVDYGTQLAMCQRYFQSKQEYFGTKSVSAYTRQNTVMPVYMRTASTVTFADLASTASKISLFAANDARTDNISVVAMSGGISNFQVLFNNSESQPGYGFTASFSAEL
jgi:hypothetical protein